MRQHRDVMADSFGADCADDDAPDVTGGLSNLADCMLVLVCGLMVAFLVHYQVFQPTAQVEPTGEKVEINTDVSGGQTSADGGKGTYERLGTLYQDTETGQMYYLQDDGSDTGSADSGK